MDLISRQDAIDAIVNREMRTTRGTEYLNGYAQCQLDIIDIIQLLPSAQPEIIHCKDCKWKQGSECVRFADVRPFSDDFCSRAERRTDD